MYYTASDINTPVGGRPVHRLGEDCVGNLRERDHLEDTGVDGCVLLRWIIRKWDVGAWTGSIWPTIGTRVGHL